MKIVFITADETPSTMGLNASQVYETALRLQQKGYDVEWIACVSMIEHLKDVIKRRSKISAIQNNCKKNGLKFDYFFYPLSLNIAFFTPFWGTLRKQIAKRLAKRLQNKGDINTILHCRSYHATSLAIEAKSLLETKNTYAVSFDMRSIFPEEMVLVREHLGPFFYAKAKQWEFFLLKNSDAAFLPLDYGIEKSLFESGFKINKIPIQGFDRDISWQPDFENRWNLKKIGYAGSIGLWHDPDILFQMFGSLPEFQPVAAMTPNPLLRDIECRLYSHSEMSSFYDGLMALVVPGRLDNRDFFVKFKMRCNFFSTKAAEALSRGVPLFVSSELKELADFVQQHEVGIIYNPETKSIAFPNPSKITKETWMKMTENAFLIGSAFTRDSVVNTYLASWNSIFSKSHERMQPPNSGLELQPKRHHT